LTGKPAGRPIKAHNAKTLALCEKTTNAGDNAMKTILAVATAVGLLSAPQLALAGEQAQTIQISVSSEGLDLNNSADLRRLRLRISNAVAEACDPSDRFIVNTLPNYACRRAAIASVEPSVRHLGDAAKRSAVTRSR
jgi:UrcA family protein